MGAKKFFVNNGGQNVGPFPLEDILEKVAQGKFQATDHIYLDDRDDWILICQHPEFLKKFTKNAPSKPLETEVAQVQSSAGFELPQEATKTEIEVPVEIGN